MKHKHNAHQQGTSTVEILITLVILVILMLSTLPSFSEILARQDQCLVIDRLKNAIEFARQEAFRRHTLITLCASTTKNSCSAKGEWSSGWIVFENPDKEWQPQEKNILSFFPGAQHGKLYFTAPGDQLHIQANGQTTNIGSFIYCPRRSSIKPKGLVINWAARSYSTDENPDKTISMICIKNLSSSFK